MAANVVLRGVRIRFRPARATLERDETVVTTLDSSAAWNSATRMVAANRDLLMAIAGVFYVLPWLASAILVPPLPATKGMSETQVLEAIQSYYVASLPILLPLSFLPMAGMLTMLIAMLDTERPTVAQAIRRSIRSLPSYVAAQLLVAFGILALSMAVAAVLPDWIALAFAFAVLLYSSMRTVLVAPVVAARDERNPVNAIRESLRLTRGTAGHILMFIALAALVFLVVYGLAMMVVSVLLVLILQGEPQRIVGELVDCALKSIGYTYFVAMLAAVYSQLTNVVSESAAG